MLPTETKQLLAGPASYNIRNSLRFRASASAYLNRTPASTTNTTIWTISVWVKRGSISSALPIDNKIIDANGNTRIYFNSSDQLSFDSGGASRIVTSSVYRDPSSWYHVVFSCNTVTGSQIFYVNGVQVTALSTNAPLTGSATTSINSNTQHVIAKNGAAAYYADFYLSEYNLIDGQALTPSSFGFYDPYTGVWMPQRYTGTYTGNSFYLPFINQSSSTFAATFNGSTQFLTTNAFLPSTNLTLGTSDFTIECWIQPSAGSAYTAVGFGNGATTYDAFPFYMSSGNLVTYLSSTASSWDVSNAQVIATSIPTTTWSHVALTRSGSTFRAYFNGVQAYTFTSSASIYQSTNAITIAKGQGGFYFAGSISNLRFVKGTALYTSNFTPPIQPLTAVTNTQLLTLQSSTVIDNSANNIPITNTGSVAMSAATPFTQPDLTADYSGLGNNWTPNNISLTAGITYDSMIDVPTNWPDGGNGRGNYCVLNFLDKFSGNVLSNANLYTNGLGLVRSTFGMTSGKWYWEVIIQAASSITGLATSAAAQNQYLGLNAFGWGYYGANGNKYNSGTNSAYGATFTTNDIIGVAFDADVGTLTFYKNGVSQGVAYSGLTSGPYYAACSDNGSVATAFAYNFGQRPFSYTPPSGFSALNTQNLVTPTILNGARFMAATTYTGNATINTDIKSSSTNSGNNPLSITFQPDLVWIKSRSNATNNNLFDSVRTATNYLISNSTAANASNANTLTAFNVDGFRLGTDAGSIGVNINTNTYVGWQWNAGSGSSTVPTGGSITPTGASINVSAGFSIIAYTGTGANATVPHGLGVAPSMIIFKRRSSTANWAVYHSSIGNTGALALDLTIATDTNIAYFNNTSPNSTVFTVGTGNSINASTSTYVSYCWAPIVGYSSFGIYTGNGSADGPFIFTGMRPRWILRKRTDTTAYWILYDTSRNPYNIVGEDLYPNDTLAGSNDFTMDILSNGFKIRGTGANINASGGTYIYAAFAENPFKLSRAR